MRLVRCYTASVMLTKKPLCADVLDGFILGTGYAVCSAFLQEDLVLALLMSSVLD